MNSSTKYGSIWYLTIISTSASIQFNLFEEGIGSEVRVPVATLSAKA